jgi:Fe-S-cluster containining protein
MITRQEIMNQLQKTIIGYSELINNSTNIGLSENEKDLFFLMDKLISEVRDTYPYVPCKDKCSACCLHAGLPRVTLAEWQLVHKFIIKEMDENTRQLIIKRTLELHGNQIEELMEEQARIQIPHTERDESKEPKPRFKCLECPLLIEGSCSIYPARPAICRAYGFFTIRVSGKSKIFTCQMAAEQIIDELKKQGVEHWALPVWDKFAEKIYEINRNNVVSTLPIWIMSHLDENKQIKTRIDKNPDFDFTSQDLFKEL